MNTKPFTLIPSLLCAALLFSSVGASHLDELSDLRARFVAREPAIQSLKSQEVVGETHLGYLEGPRTAPTGDAKNLMDAENADRRRLYALIAAKDGAAPELVADRAAKRNFSRARPGDMLKFPDGTWRKAAAR